MAELTERQICDQLWKWQKEGQRSRRYCTPNPYPANTIAHSMHSAGWLIEDLRLALMEADPKYGAQQRRFEHGGHFL